MPYMIKYYRITIDVTERDKNIMANYIVQHGVKNSSGWLCSVREGFSSLIKNWCDDEFRHRNIDKELGLDG